jgi:Ca-activated chloride channel family protein
MQSRSQDHSNSERTGGTPVNVTLRMYPERRFIRIGGSFRYIDFYIRVDHVPTKVNVDRMPLTLALVLDRSGSMQGEKLATAKRAALSVLDRLDERDSAAVVVFDDRIDTVQALAPVTTNFKAGVRKALAEIEARASTALHEGWLTGCKAIASDTPPSRERSLARCFLLTDGLANVGMTDPEQIASEAAGIREHAGIGTSTFGIGNDYNESLLGPMAVAGGGQFHHLRTASEIANTFVGELGNLLSVAASQVRIEIEVESGMSADLVSAYWVNASSTNTLRQSITIGDLVSDEERHVIVRFGFPKQHGQDGQTVRARLVWMTDGSEQSSDWQTVHFSYADQRICDSELRDPKVMHWVGLHQADRAQREALQLNQRGDLQGAHEKLKKVAQEMEEYAGGDQELQAEVKSLRASASAMSAAPLPSQEAKERYYQQQSRSRGQKDYRKSGPA